MVKVTIALALSAASLAAQNAKPAPSQPAALGQSSEMRDARHREGLVATRAIANLESLESIETNLASIGVQLSGDLISLRARVEASLDAADAAIEKNNAKAANEALDRAEGYLNRLAARLGG